MLVLIGNAHHDVTAQIANPAVIVIGCGLNGREQVQGTKAGENEDAATYELVHASNNGFRGGRSAERGGVGTGSAIRIARGGEGNRHGLRIAGQLDGRVQRDSAARPAASKARAASAG